jgi:hypothetical protein
MIIKGEKRVKNESRVSAKHKIIWDEMFRYVYEGVEFIVVMDHKYLKEDGKYHVPKDDAFMSQVPAEFWDDEEKFNKFADYCIANPEYAEQLDIALGYASPGKYCSDKDYQYIKDKLENQQSSE